jgi:hypothetical protein
MGVILLSDKNIKKPTISIATLKGSVWKESKVEIKTMKILIFDDSVTNRNAAQAQLKDHDLTIVGTYDEAEKILDGPTTFDVVLTDLLVPASRRAQGSMALVGVEMPVGIFIGLLAAVRGRVKYAAVFTDSDHHSHPASACFDAFNKEGESYPTPFMVEGSKFLLSNTRNWVGQFDPKDLSKMLECEEYSKRSDTVSAKNWSKLLAHLVS